MYRPKAFNELLPPMFQNYFTKRHVVHDHYTRAFGSRSVTYNILEQIIEGFQYSARVQLSGIKSPLIYSMYLRLPCSRRRSRISSFHRRDRRDYSPVPYASILTIAK